MSAPITTSWDTYVSRSSFLANLMFKSSESDEVYKKMVDVVGSDYSPLSDGVETHSVSGLGPIKKRGETTPFEYDAPGPGDTKKSYYENYALAVQFTENMILYAKYNIIEKVVAGLGEGYNLARNLQVAGMYDDAFTGAYFTGPDNQPLISANHGFPGTGLIRSNTLATQGPLGYESAKSLMTVMKRQKTPRGYPMPALKSGQTIRVVVPPEAEFEAYKIFNTEARLDPTNNSNAVNAMRAGNHNYEIVVNPYLTSTSQWYFINPDQVGVKLVDKQGLTKDEFQDRFTKGMQYDVRAMWVLHPEMWEYIYGGNG